MGNPILIGQVQEIDLQPPAIRAMVNNPGIYLCGDTSIPEYTVPVASIDGVLHSMTLDDVLDPERFKATVTVAGPFFKHGDMQHSGECLTDQASRDVCDGMYVDKCDDVLGLCEALRAVLALAGEDPQVRKIVDDAIAEHGA